MYLGLDEEVVRADVTVKDAAFHPQAANDTEHLSGVV